MLVVTVSGIGAGEYGKAGVYGEIGLFPPRFEDNALDEAIGPTDYENTAEKCLRECNPDEELPNGDEGPAGKGGDAAEGRRPGGRRLYLDGGGSRVDHRVSYAKASERMGPSANSAPAPVSLPMVAAMLI